MKIFYYENFTEKKKYLKEKYSIENLSSNREKRLMQLKNLKDKENFIIAEYITFEILEKEYAITNPKIKGAAGEKPRLIDKENIYYSRSYSDNNLVLAFSKEGPVGIDMEKISPVDYGVVKYFFTEEEKIYLDNSQNKDLAFTEIWTRKESYMKYLGQGLNFPFDRLNTLKENLNIKTINLDNQVISLTGEKNYEKDNYRLL